MKRFAILFNLVFIILLQLIIAKAETSEHMARYDYYRVYYVNIETEKHVEILQKLEEQSDSCTFIGHARHPKQILPIIVAAHKVADFEDLLNTYEIKRRILTTNFQEKIDKNLEGVQPKNIGAEMYDWNHYFHLNTINEWLSDQASKHADVAKLLDIGSSAEGLPMMGIKISYNSSSDQAIVIESGIHAREWIAPATATYIINELLNANNETIRNLVNSIDFYIFPIINPDGYKYSFNGDRMWRKNRELFGICRGIDLNRNFPFHWNTTGTSGDPCRYDYSGPKEASAVETQNLMGFVRNISLNQKIRGYFSLHSYSQLIMFPYGHSSERIENYADMKEFGKKAADRIEELSGRVYRSGSIYETIYPSSGGSKDWAYGEMKIPITFTFELRGQQDSEDLFLLPAEEIKPTAEEAFAAILTILQEAKAKHYFD